MGTVEFDIEFRGTKGSSQVVDVPHPPRRALCRETHSGCSSFCRSHIAPWMLDATVEQTLRREKAGADQSVSGSDGGSVEGSLRSD